MYRTLIADQCEELVKRANEENAEIISVFPMGARFYGVVKGGKPASPHAYASAAVSFRPKKPEPIAAEPEAKEPEKAKEPAKAKPKPRTVEPKPEPVPDEDVVKTEPVL